MTRVSAELLGVRITTADYRHIAKAINRKFIRSGGDNVDEDMDEEDIDEADAVHDLMAAHSAKTANLKYGQDGNMLQGLNNHSIDVFR